MNPEEQNHDLTAQQFGELDPESTAKLEARLAEDAELAAEADELGQLLELLASEPPADSPTSLDDKRRAEILAAAAEPATPQTQPWWPVILPLAAAASVVLLGTWLTRAPQPSMEMASTPKDALTAPSAPEAAIQAESHEDTLADFEEDAKDAESAAESMAAPATTTPMPVADSHAPGKSAPLPATPAATLKKAPSANDVLQAQAPFPNQIPAPDTELADSAKTDITITADAEISSLVLEEAAVVELDDRLERTTESARRMRADDESSANLIVANSSVANALPDKALDRDTVVNAPQVNEALSSLTKLEDPQLAAAGEAGATQSAPKPTALADDKVIVSGAARVKPAPGAAVVDALDAAGAAPGAADDPAPPAPRSLAAAERQRFGGRAKAAAPPSAGGTKREAFSQDFASRGANAVDAGALLDVKPPKALLRKLKRAAAKGDLPLVLPFSRDGITYVAIAMANTRATKLSESNRPLWQTIDSDNGAHYWVLRRDQAESLGLRPSPK